MAKVKARKGTKLKVVPGGKLTAVYRRDPEDLRFWLAHIAEDDRCHTFGRSFKQARANLLDVASLWFEREVALADLEETFDLPQDVRPWADGYARAKADLVRAEQHCDAMRYGLIRGLLDADISLRPSAQIVGTLGKEPISYQRVQQIATDPELEAFAEDLSYYLHLPGGKPESERMRAAGSSGGAVALARKAAPKRRAAKKRATKKRACAPKKKHGVAKKKNAGKRAARKY